MCGRIFRPEPLLDPFIAPGSEITEVVGLIDNDEVEIAPVHLIEGQAVRFAACSLQIGVIEDGGNWSGMGLLKLPLVAERVGTSSEVAKVGTELSIADYRLA